MKIHLIQTYLSDINAFKVSCYQVIRRIKHEEVSRMSQNWAKNQYKIRGSTLDLHLLYIFNNPQLTLTMIVLETLEQNHRKLESSDHAITTEAVL